MKKIKVIAVVGSTASGKSTLAERLTPLFNGERISVDSRTVYRGMDIGTAKTPGILGNDLIHPNEEYSVALFKEYADETIKEIVAKGKLPILVGGTGLWLDVILENISLPAIAPDFKLRAELERKSVEELLQMYHELDSQGAEVVEQKNKRRLIRAIEVTRISGKPFSLQQEKKESTYDVLWIGVDRSRKNLIERINQRVDQMILDGFIDEVRILRDQYGCEMASMSAIGYKQICAFLAGDISQKVAIEDIKIKTRQYAKRQMTWFKRNLSIQWMNDNENPEDLVKKFLF